MIRHASLALLITASLQVQNAPAPAVIVNKLDTPQARVYVATLQPRTPSRHYKVEFENDQVRVLRVHYEAHDEGARHEQLLNRVVVYLNDQPGAKADDVRMSGPA